MEKTPKDECHDSSPECPSLHFLPILNAPESCVCAESSLQLKAAYGSNSLHVLVETMKTHEDVEVQLFGTMGIASVCNGADWERQKHAANAGVLEALLHAIRYGSQLPAVQQWVARCFECLPLILRSFIKTLRDHPEDAKLQVLSAMCLARMHRAESFKEAADAGVAKAFVQAMQTHALDAEVQNAAAFGLYVNCRAANPERFSPSHLAGETTQCALDHGAAWALLEAARTHGQNPAALYNCTLALGSIVWSRASVCGEHAADIVYLLLRTLKWNRKDFRVRMLASNCLRNVPKAMRHLVEAMNFVPFDGDVQHWSSWCLAEACSEEVVGQDVLGYPSDPVLRALVSAMQNHAADAQLQFHAAMALGTICAGWDVNAFKRQNEAIDAGALQVVVQAMQNHLYDAKVQAASARCFARMVFTSASAGGDGPRVLLQAYNIHQGDADVQKWMALGLARVRDESIARTDILNILCKVMKAYPKDAEVQYLASLGIGHLRA